MRVGLCARVPAGVPVPFSSNQPSRRAQRQPLAPVRSATDGHNLPLVIPSAIIPPPSRGSQYGKTDDDGGSSFGSPGGPGWGGSSRGQRRTTADDDPGRQQRQGAFNVAKSLGLRLLALMLKYFLVVSIVFHVTSFVLAVVRTVYNTGVHLRGGGISSSEVLTGTHNTASSASLSSPSSSSLTGEDAAPLPPPDHSGPAAAAPVRPRRVLTWIQVVAAWAAILAGPFFFSYMPDSKF